MKELISKIITDALSDVPELPEIIVDIPKVKRFGDFSTNLAILLAPRSVKKLPDLAQELADKIRKQDQDGIFSSVEAVKTGFINFKLKDEFLRHQVSIIREQGPDYGKSELGKGKRVLIEFVSANPTGPLHIGHGRWAVIGDDIASVLQAAGYTVEREFYVNDVGNQVEKLEESVIAIAENKEAPEGGYGGFYVKEIAQQLKGEIHKPTFRNILLNRILEDQKRILRELGVSFDRFFREKDLHESGRVESAVLELKKQKVTFEEAGALWFKSQEYGDDKNRVLVRENGEPTYFAADIAYHLDKFKRGYDQIINIWGADHHGYVLRLRSALQSLKLPIEKFKIIIGQLVALFRGAEPVRMSKRTGEMITLEEVISEIGKDATRFFLTMVTASSHLEFDLELAKHQALDNPVFYVQYAHARIRSIFREGDEKGIQLKDQVDLSFLTHEAERELMRKLTDLPDIIITSARRMEPHILVEYAKGVSAIFHNYYHKCRVLSEDEKLTQARLALVDATRITLKNVLELLKVEVPERM
jgi:arginyl-tRNA synthetase